MHKAPTVDYPVGPSRFYGLVLLGIGLGAIVLHVMWCYRVEVLGWRQWLGFVVTLATGLFGLHAWRISPRGVLRWDGAWSWESGGVRITGLAEAVLDFQSLLLLCFRADTGARQWFWLERRSPVTRWDALRRAVHGLSRNDSGTAQTTLSTQPVQHGGVIRP